MTELDKRWYNGLTRALGLSRNSFQPVRPCALLAATDLALWEQLDTVPPATLIFDRSNQENLRFSQQHENVIHRLGFGDEAVFQTLLGTDTYRKWSEYVAGITPRPALTQLPSIFLNWAMLQAPNMATAGVSALARGALAKKNPSAERSRSDARTAGEYEGTYNDLGEKLLSGSAAEFALRFGEIAPAVEDTWANGANDSELGLLAGDLADSPVSRTFAGSAISVEVRFQRYTVWHAKPGSWFDAAGMRTAFENRISPRWGVGYRERWEDFFGVRGTMARAIESVVVVDGISVTVKSDAVMGPVEQAEVRSRLMRGVWPFYIPDSEIARNGVEFDSSGALTLTLVVETGHPAVIGNNVVGIGRYLGIPG